MIAFEPLSSDERVRIIDLHPEVGDLFAFRYEDFSLEDGDEVSITISGIGTLTNPVVKI